MGRTYQGICEFSIPADWEGTVYLENGDLQASYKAAEEADEHTRTNPGHETKVMIGDDGQ
jgi:hypothetical protein